jgi:hypothetical protein
MSVNLIELDQAVSLLAPIVKRQKFGIEWVEQTPLGVDKFKELGILCLLPTDTLDRREHHAEALNAVMTLIKATEDLLPALLAKQEALA